jgi:hypothetical protein
MLRENQPILALSQVSELRRDRPRKFRLGMVAVSWYFMIYAMLIAFPFWVSWLSLALIARDGMRFMVQMAVQCCHLRLVSRHSEFKHH